MAGGSGFTDQDLKNLQKDDNDSKVSQYQKPSKIDKKPQKKPTDNKRSAKVPIRKVQEHSSFEIKNSKEDDQTNVSSENHNAQLLDKVPDVSVSDEKKTSTVKKEEKQEPEKSDNNIRVLTDTEAAKEQMSSLEKLQQQQKIIEEQNKKKQTMIKETLAERMQQTQNESLKLKDINKELSRLDNLLQVDVKILRDKIDGACVEFSNAQKRFEVAEKEYVTAKMDYHKKKEHKDQLQECLYTIIQENEIRKAKKLEELMAKLTQSLKSPVSSPVTPTASEFPSPSTENREDIS